MITQQSQLISLQDLSILGKEFLYAEEGVVLKCQEGLPVHKNGTLQHYINNKVCHTKLTWIFQ